MLDWLKAILGAAYSDEVDKKVEVELEKSFVPRADFSTLTATKAALETQISERDKQLSELQKLKPEDLQAEIKRLQGENTSAAAKFDADLKSARLEYALDARLASVGAVNVKAVKALLDGSKISLDGDNLVGLDEQLKSLKESEKWAFAPDVKAVPGVGGNPPPNETTGKNPLPKGTVVF